MSSTRQFLTFASIGVVGTSGHYVTLITLVQLLEVDPVIATSVGFGVGALINYILNYHLTFKSRKRHREALSKFLLVAAIGAVVNAAIMSVGVSRIEIHYIVIQLLATALVLIWNYAANKLWTFAD